MEVTWNEVLEVSRSDQVGMARRAATTLARELGFDSGDEGRIALAVTEAGSNVVKHAQGGQILIGCENGGGVGSLSFLALDTGPGITDLPESMRDGFSSAGTPGTGLGAISRQADLFDVYTRPGVGTALLARFWRGRTRSKLRSLIVGGVSIPARGETLCGDGWCAVEHRDRTALLVVDGLGHGPLAHEASRQAIEVFEAESNTEPAAVLERVHDALRATRGASGAVASVSRDGGVVKYCGVGNISGVIHSDSGSRHLVSHHGTLGHEARKFQEFTYEWPDAATLVLHSDGLQSHWDLGTYAGLLGHDPLLIASILYRDFTRGRDDVTVVVARRGR